jgi:hypothetical protein
MERWSILDITRRRGHLFLFLLQRMSEIVSKSRFCLGRIVIGVFY